MFLGFMWKERNYFFFLSRDTQACWLILCTMNIIETNVQLSFIFQKKTKAL